MKRNWKDEAHLLASGPVWPNKSPTYKLKSEISDLFCQTPPTYKSPLLISFKLVHPCLKLISHPFPRGAHTFNQLISHLQPNRHNL